MYSTLLKKRRQVIGCYDWMNDRGWRMRQAQYDTVYAAPFKMGIVARRILTSPGPNLALPSSFYPF